MSNDQYSPYADMSNEEMMAMYGSMEPGFYGDNYSKRLNQLQDLEQILGTSLVQTAGVTNPAAAQYQEPMNQTGAMYGSNDYYATAFQAIEDGADPISAANAVREQYGMNGMTQDEFTQTVIPIVTQYASERIKNQQDRATWEAENGGGGWTTPEGSKYKQTPLGGNDVRATASEYELMGAPTEEALIAEYASGRNPSRRVTGGQGVSASGGVGADGFGWSASGSPLSRPSSSPSTAPSLPMARPPVPEGTPAQLVQYGMESNAAGPRSGGGGVMNNIVAEAVRRSQSGSPTSQAPGLVQPRTAGGGQFSDNPLVEKYAQKEAKGDTGRYVNKMKNQRVRSDANVALMRRITALAGLMQGGYPE